MDTTGDNNQWRKVGILVSNSGPSDASLDTAVIHYAMHESTLSLNSAIWYFQIHDTTWKYNVQGVGLVVPTLSLVNDSTVNLNLSFKNGYKIPANGAMEIQFGVSHTDYSIIDQTKDPDYIASTVYMPNSSVPFQQTVAPQYSARTTLGIYGTIVPCCTRK
jgi:hypothetical protein